MGVPDAALKHRDAGLPHHPHEEPMSHGLKSCHDPAACEVATDRSVDDRLNMVLKFNVVPVASTFELLPMEFSLGIEL